MIGSKITDGIGIDHKVVTEFHGITLRYDGEEGNAEGITLIQSRGREEVEYATRTTKDTAALALLTLLAIEAAVRWDLDDADGPQAPDFASVIEHDTDTIERRNAWEFVMADLRRFADNKPTGEKK